MDVVSSSSFEIIEAYAQHYELFNCMHETKRTCWWEYLKAEMASFLHKGWRMVLATPGGAGPHDGVMQARHKVGQVAACGAGSRHTAVEPLLRCKLIYVAHKLDVYLRSSHCHSHDEPEQKRVCVSSNLSWLAVNAYVDWPQRAGGKGLA